MERVVIAALIVIAAVAVAAVASRRRPDAPTQARGLIPSQIDRADFGATTPVLIVLFTSSTCAACADALAVAEPLRGPDVEVVVAELSERGDLHTRYRIDAVPTMVVSDRDGVVVAGFSGTPHIADARSAVATALADP